VPWALKAGLRRHGTAQQRQTNQAGNPSPPRAKARRSQPGGGAGLADRAGRRKASPAKLARKVGEGPWKSKPGVGAGQQPQFSLARPAIRGEWRRQAPPQLSDVNRICSGRRRLAWRKLGMHGRTAGPSRHGPAPGCSGQVSNRRHLLAIKQGHPSSPVWRRNAAGKQAVKIRRHRKVDATTPGPCKLFVLDPRHREASPPRPANGRHGGWLRRWGSLARARRCCPSLMAARARAAGRNPGPAPG